MALTEWLRQRIENSYVTSNNSFRVNTAGSYDPGLDISSGGISGTTYIHKFGNAPDFDTTDNSVTIWDGANDGVINQMVYQYSATAAIDSVSSSNATDTQTIEIQGLDTDWVLTTQTVTLTGQTRKALTTSLIRVFRMKNTGTTNFAGYIYCYENTALTAGVPNDPTKVRAVVSASNNQTLMSIYTIPAGKTGYLRSWYVTTAGASKTTQYVIDLFARPFGKVFQLKHRSSISDTGTSYINHEYIEPEMFSEKTDIEMKAQMLAVGATGASVSSGFDLVLIDS